MCLFPALTLHLYLIPLPPHLRYVASLDGMYQGADGLRCWYSGRRWSRCHYGHRCWETPRQRKVWRKDHPRCVWTLYQKTCIMQPCFFSLLFSRSPHILLSCCDVSLPAPALSCAECILVNHTFSHTLRPQEKATDSVSEMLSSVHRYIPIRCALKVGVHRQRQHPSHLCVRLLRSHDGRAAAGVYGLVLFFGEMGLYHDSGAALSLLCSSPDPPRSVGAWFQTETVILSNVRAP